MKRNLTIREAKTKMLISCAFTAQLICIFVLAQAKIRFSHDAAQIFILYVMVIQILVFKLVSRHLT